MVNGEFKDAFDVFKKFKNKNAKENTDFVLKNKDDYFKPYTGLGCLYTELPNGYVMCIKHLDSWISTVGLVAHESLHLTHYILRRAGIELTKESEEAFTYLQEDIIKKILNKIY